MRPTSFSGRFIRLAALLAPLGALLFGVPILLLALSGRAPTLTVLHAAGFGLGGLALGLTAAFLGALLLSLMLGAIKSRYSVQFSDRAEFLSRLIPAMREIRFRLHSQTTSTMSFEPASFWGFMLQPVKVQIKENSSEIEGPPRYIKKLQRRIG